MSLSLTNKSIIGIASSAAIGGAAYGVHHQFFSTTNMRDALLSRSKTPLNLDTTAGTEDYEHLEELARQYSGTNIQGKTKIEGLTLKHAKDIEPLIAKCKELLNLNSKDPNYENKLKQAEEWCTKEGAPRKITTLLKKRGRVLIENKSGNVEDWSVPWNKFKEKYQANSTTGEWEMANWENLNKGAVPEEFKIKCAANGAKSIILDKEMDFLKEIEEYCTKAITT